MKKVRKRKWSTYSSMTYIQRVNCGRAPFGLTYLSACDFLGLTVLAAQAAI